MSKAKTLAGTVSTGGVLANPSAIPVANITGLATVATSGAYADLSGKPSLATVATSGSYNDLIDKPTITTTATNIAGGSNGTIPYQSAAGTTQMLAAGTAGYLLQSNGAAAPSWVTVPAAGQNTFVATGAITQGNPVTLRSDGTVEVTTGDVGA